MLEGLDVVSQPLSNLPSRFTQYATHPIPVHDLPLCSSA